VLTELNDRQGAALAWGRLRKLDRHKIYGAQIEACRDLWDTVGDASDPS
jgi:hypothetical protein